jgi:ABC-type multidrug transport system fused ATPase/permease subunit
MGKLLVKLHKPLAGTISLNGVNYDKIPRHILRQNIAYVSQRPFLFDGTIRQNILIGNPHADEETGGYSSTS